MLRFFMTTDRKWVPNFTITKFKSTLIFSTHSNQWPIARSTYSPIAERDIKPWDKIFGSITKFNRNTFFPDLNSLLFESKCNFYSDSWVKLTFKVRFWHFFKDPLLCLFTKYKCIPWICWYSYKNITKMWPTNLKLHNRTATNVNIIIY